MLKLLTQVYLLTYLLTLLRLRHSSHQSPQQAVDRLTDGYLPVVLRRHGRIPDSMALELFSFGAPAVRKSATRRKPTTAVPCMSQGMGIRLLHTLRDDLLCEFSASFGGGFGLELLRLWRHGYTRGCTTCMPERHRGALLREGCVSRRRHIPSDS